MSTMSASPPVGLPLSLITEHKTSTGKAPLPSPVIPIANPQQVTSVPSSSVTLQPQTNGLELIDPTPPSGPSRATSPSSSASFNSTSINSQGTSHLEGGPVAPGNGTSSSGGSGEVERNKAVVGDTPPVDAQPSVPPTPATVPPAVEASNANPESQDQAISPNIPSSPSTNEPPGPVPAVLEVSQPPLPSEASFPATSSPASLPPYSVSVPVPSGKQDNPKSLKSRKRKFDVNETVNSKGSSITEIIDSTDDGRKSKRTRLPTQPYQSPLPELHLIAKMNTSSKAIEEKLIVFYRNEFLAVRNSDGGFYICQAMQNIYRSSLGNRSKIKIRWFSQGGDDIFTPDFYDSTEFDCILTNLNINKIGKDRYKLPPFEKRRTESILKRAIDVEMGIVLASDTTLTEEHPDGLDLSLYRHEDQLKKKRKVEKKITKVKSCSRKSTGCVNRSNKEHTINEKSSEKTKPKISRKRVISKKNEKKMKKKSGETKNNEITERNCDRPPFGVQQSPRKKAEKTKSVAGAKPGNKASPGNLKQNTPFSSNTARQSTFASSKP